jgi:hypothetical protein
LDTGCNRAFNNNFNWLNLKQLKKVDASSSALNDEGMHKLSRIFSLESIYVYFCTGLTSDAFSCLHKLPKLLHLDVSMVESVDDNTIADICKISSLVKLELESCKNITDECLPHFTKLTNLRDLEISDCDLTYDKVEKLLPKVNIIY